MRLIRTLWKNPVLACVAMAALFFAARVAFAENTKVVHYSLVGLRPLGISQHSVPARSAQREYIRFQNEKGSHTFIYEEAQGTPELGELKHFREVMGRWEMNCSVELDCKIPAFCTGTCKNFYYEMSNTPEDLALLERNQCVMLTYRCDKPTKVGMQ